MNFRPHIEKLQNLSDQKKKIILWTVVVILGIVLLIFWVKSAANSFSKIGEQVGQIKLTEIQTPELNIPNIEAETADWQTYTNVKYGFEVKYPSDWDTMGGDGTGVELSPKSKLVEQGSVRVGFYGRGTALCKILFADYVKIAGPQEIQNYESLNTIKESTNDNGLDMFQITWNYTDMQGNEKISLPITYFETKPELCGDIEASLNDNNYSDIYNKIISTFKFTN